MIKYLFTIALVAFGAVSLAQTSNEADRAKISPELANRFARLALDCIQQEFPNKVSRTTDNAEAIGRPRIIFPAFYGCFDWHSAVHLSLIHI